MRLNSLLRSTSLAFLVSVAAPALAQQEPIPPPPDPPSIPTLTSPLDPEAVPAPTITITSQGNGQIRYTWDGSVPTLRSAVYSGPLSFTAGGTLKARVFPDFSEGGITFKREPSAVASADFHHIRQAAAPVFSVLPGTYATRQTIEIKSITPGAIIRYTLDGTEPQLEENGSSRTVRLEGVLLEATAEIRARAWGGQGSGLASSPISVGRWEILGEISSYRNVLVLRADGSVWAAGSNESGQLGLGHYQAQSSLVRIPALNDIVSVLASRDSGYAVDRQGSVFAWGANPFGKLGVPTNGVTGVTSRPLPDRVAGLQKKIRQIAGSDHVIAALDTEGGVWAWGMFRGGTFSPQPRKLEGLPRIVQVAADLEHILAVAENGTVWSMGVLGTGDGGFPPTEAYVPARVSLPLPPAAIQVATGIGHGAALMVDNTIWTWGRNDQGQLGRPSSSEDGITHPIEGADSLVEVAAGNTSTLARRSDGRVFLWGSLSPGLRESGSALLAQVNGARRIAAGTNSNFSIDSAGRVWTWGRNTGGQLGNADPLDHLLPRGIANFRTFSPAPSSVGEILHLRADRGLSFATVDCVAAWMDNSPGGHDATSYGEAAWPRRFASSMQQRDAIRFTAPGQVLQFAEGAFRPSDGFSAFFALQSLRSTGPGTLFQVSAAGGGGLLSLGRSDQDFVVQFSGAGSGATVRVTNGCAVENIVVVEVIARRLDALQMEFSVYLNGSHRGTSTVAIAAGGNWGSASLGNVALGGSPFGGEVGEILWYDRPLSEEQRRQAGEYLAERFLPVVAPRPVGLTAQVVSANRVELAWPSADSSVTKYLLERRVGNEAWVSLASLPPGQLSFTDTAAPNGSTVEYRLVHINSSGRSDRVGTDGSLRITVALPYNNDSIRRKSSQTGGSSVSLLKDFGATYLGVWFLPPAQAVARVNSLGILESGERTLELSLPANTPPFEGAASKFLLIRTGPLAGLRREVSRFVGNVAVLKGPEDLATHPLGALAVASGAGGAAAADLVSVHTHFTIDELFGPADGGPPMGSGLIAAGERIGVYPAEPQGATSNEPSNPEYELEIYSTTVEGSLVTGWRRVTGTNTGTEGHEEVPPFQPLRFTRSTGSTNEYLVRRFLAQGFLPSHPLIVPIPATGSVARDFLFGWSDSHPRPLGAAGLTGEPGSLREVVRASPDDSEAGRLEQVLIFRDSYMLSRIPGSGPSTLNPSFLRGSAPPSWRYGPDPERGTQFDPLAWPGTAFVLRRPPNAPLRYWTLPPWPRED